MANGNNNHPELSICDRPHYSLPVAPEAAALLRTLLSQQTADLQAITETIESDLGLTIQLYQLAAQQPGMVPVGVFEVSEVVVHLGLKRLRTMISGNTSLRAQRTVSLLPS